MNTPEKEMSIVQHLDQCTVRIECDSGVGTGFFFAVGQSGKIPQDGEPFVPLIITNQHVIGSSTTIRFVISATDSAGKVSHHQFSHTTAELRLTTHPNGVDLACLNIGVVLNFFSRNQLKPAFTWLDASIIPSSDQFKALSPISDIVLVGYPTGLWDHTNNRPIFRRGITATTPHVKWQGRDEFLIDAAIFGGSSGSPVFIFNEGSYSSPEGIVIGSRLLLIGVNRAVYVHNTEGRLVQSPSPSGHSLLPVTGIPNNLGVAISIRQLRALIDEAIKPQGWRPYGQPKITVGGTLA
ncbi:TPA: trypsin-like peptidase domain-containing protein [Stenotrophomonas maltophilia]|uniref:S1 family peptidase n=1 Tax=Stenotrophomonas maltophilia TaxID=40324 RepID=UPI0011F0C349|nr:serine protease [Stenotrophomonas maltophilia]EKT4448023.1 trypsin-like peptidase domain-containing protein [Stenotrophomonas maltophilia]MBN5079068.1 trypsin-like peptidase domain-containing protein [Stenotrophomonas maltophilia]UKJ26235.1 serine protease [Stenotrophomonas maltophilia]HDS1638667.1 trypsin-like peptidase domain-containing protein [Stenotrophomonas maltophilia]HEL4192020.1 trypsin-like peptidase domain-containing protein [Stenotrophomonas maltophilia]